MHHHSEYLKYQATKVTTGKRKASNINSGIESKKPKLRTIGSAFEKKLQSNKMVSQSEVEDSLVSLLVEDMQPLSKLSVQA